VPVNAYAIRLLERYLGETRPRITVTAKAMQNSDGCVFLSNHGKKFMSDVVTRMIAEYASRAGLQKRVTAHWLRHSCATHLLQNGMDIRYIQQFLGHRKLDSTTTYTRVVIRDLQETVQKYHPLEISNEYTRTNHCVSA